MVEEFSKDFTIHGTKSDKAENKTKDKMNMQSFWHWRRWKRTFLGIGIGVVILGVYALCSICYTGVVRGREAANGTTMADVKIRISGFWKTGKRDLKDGAELGFDKGVIDALSDEKFVWSATLASTKEPRPILWQPKPYRTKLWPFGEMKQMALYSDGSVRDLFAEDVGP